MLEVGMRLEVERIVTENDTAAKAASGAVEVLATPIMTVKIVSVLKEIDRKRLVFDVEVLEDGIAVGTGSHTRFIIDTAKFYEKLKNK